MISKHGYFDFKKNPTRKYINLPNRGIYASAKVQAHIKDVVSAPPQAWFLHRRQRVVEAWQQLPQYSKRLSLTEDRSEVSGRLREQTETHSFQTQAQAKAKRPSFPGSRTSTLEVTPGPTLHTNRKNDHLLNISRDNFRHESSINAKASRTNICQLPRPKIRTLPPYSRTLFRGAAIALHG